MVSIREAAARVLDNGRLNRFRKGTEHALGFSQRWLGRKFIDCDRGRPAPLLRKSRITPDCRAYPAASGNASICRTMLPNRRPVRWLSANYSQ